ncbi:lipopolysaccharide biosynthesis protein [Microbacterium sp. AG1240]|uniref:lipopolysaccharide biosynthesis protein n=1 Tax=Microbacterium sp. AG1240 TaxID=2183992 RepID=UPI00160144DE|nr:oligosaccharide flippase family protein [Microbacterium sp. AG1240]
MASLFQAIWFAAFAREAGPADFGVFGVVLSGCLLAGAALGFGFGSYALRMTESGTNHRSTVTTMLITRIGTTVAIVSVAAAIALSTADSSSAVVLVGALSAAVELLGELGQGVMSGQRKILRAALVLVGQRLAPLCGILIGSAFGDSLGGLSLGLGVALGVTTLGMLPYLSVPSSLFALIARSRHYWSASLLSNVSQLESPLIGIVAGAGPVGLYAAANRVVSPASLLANALLNVLVPEIASQDDETRRLDIFRRVRLAAFGLLFGLIMLSFPASYAVLLVLGPEYSEAFPIVAGFVIAAGVSGVSKVYQSMLFAIGDARSVARSIGVGAVVGLACVAVIGVALSPGWLGLAPVAAQVVILGLMALAFSRVRPNPGGEVQ